MSSLWSVLAGVLQGALLFPLFVILKLVNFALKITGTKAEDIVNSLSTSHPLFYDLWSKHQSRFIKLLGSSDFIISVLELACKIHTAQVRTRIHSDLVDLHSSCSGACRPGFRRADKDS